MESRSIAGHNLTILEETHRASSPRTRGGRSPNEIIRGQANPPNRRRRRRRGGLEASAGPWRLRAPPEGGRGRKEAAVRGRAWEAEDRDMNCYGAEAESRIHLWRARAPARRVGSSTQAAARSVRPQPLPESGPRRAARCRGSWSTEGSPDRRVPRFGSPRSRSGERRPQEGRRQGEGSPAWRRRGAQVGRRQQESAERGGEAGSSSSQKNGTKNAAVIYMCWFQLRSRPP